jgi:hypothetical protein
MLPKACSMRSGNTDNALNKITSIRLIGLKGEACPSAKDFLKERKIPLYAGSAELIDNLRSGI